MDDKGIELVTVADLGRRWDRSRHAAWRRTQRASFPKPFTTTSSGKLWLLDDVVAWEQKMAEYDRFLKGE